MWYHLLLIKSNSQLLQCEHCAYTGQCKLLSPSHKCGEHHLLHVQLWLHIFWHHNFAILHVQCLHSHYRRLVQRYVLLPEYIINIFGFKQTTIY